MIHLKYDRQPLHKWSFNLCSDWNIWMKLYLRLFICSETFHHLINHKILPFTYLSIQLKPWFAIFIFQMNFACITKIDFCFNVHEIGGHNLPPLNYSTFINSFIVLETSICTLKQAIKLNIIILVKIIPLLYRFELCYECRSFLWREENI